MQLVVVSLVMFFLVLTQEVNAQIWKKLGRQNKGMAKDDTTKTEIKDSYVRPDWKTINIDFLSSYYAQDGNNGAVTGGIGTEQLTDFTQKVILSVPMSPKLNLNVDAGYDYYSSASTDNIDNIRASDSASDMRTHGNIGLSYAMTDTKTVGFRLGGSAEYDYFSVNGGVNFSLQTPDRNTAVQLGLQAFFDKCDVIFPQELRRTASVPTDKRQSFNGSLGISRVINKRTQVQLMLEGTYMTGLLSTPFHRVYFQEQNDARIELLPDTRLKVPLGLRLNHHLSEKLILRSYYRYYWDDWGIRSHTASVEVPLKFSRFFSIAPFYRYHTQTASDYFAGYKEHSVNDAFYSSDYDLAELSSHSYGMGLSFSPANGIAKIKKPFARGDQSIMLKSIDLKYSHYDRSTGLQADIISLGISISL